MRNKFLLLYVFLSTMISQETVLAAVPLNFEPRRPPAKLEWIRFMDLSGNEAESLWNDQLHKGTKLADWDWKWRLGWIGLCRKGNKPAFCSTVLADGLADKALVVRAESASAMGKSHAASMDPEASRKLLAMLDDPRNRRGKTPVMVQKRALYALHQIGHAESNKAAAAIAAKDPVLKEYWSKLAGGIAD